MYRGYATDENEDTAPLTHMIANRLGKRLSDVRKNYDLRWFRPQGETQIIDFPVIIQRQVAADQVVPAIVKLPQTLLIDSAEDIPVVQQSLLPTAQTIQKTKEIPQLQCIDKVVDNPVAQVPRVQVVEKTVEIPQLHIVEKSAETQTIHGTQTSESMVITPVCQVARDRVQQRCGRTTTSSSLMRKVSVDEDMKEDHSANVGDIAKKTVDSKNHHKNDVYVTCEGKVLRRSEELKSCEVRDGCTVHVVSRLRGGGKHKDKKGKVEKKQITRQEPMSGENRTTPERDENKMIQLLDEDNMKAWIDFWSKGSDDEVGRKMENWMNAFQERSEVDNERANIWKCGMRWAVETKRKEREGEQEQRRGSKSKSNGGRESKSRPQDKSKANKASTCVSEKKNSLKRHERKAQPSWK